MSDLSLTFENFTERVLQSSVPALVDFWAPWCGPCKIMAPVVEALAEDMKGKIAVGKVNVDEDPDLAQSYNILSIPTFIVFKGGKVVEQFSGAMSKEQLAEKVMKHI